MRKLINAFGKEKIISAFTMNEILSVKGKTYFFTALSKKDIMKALIAASGGKERLIKSLLGDLKPEQRQKLLLQSSRNGASKRQNGKVKVH